MGLKNLSVVLVEPQGALNIGSVSRVMMNFGAFDLRLVRPQVDHLADDARRMALKAVGILEQAALFDTLEEAIEDCWLTIGTTRRFGKYRQDFLNPDQAAWARGGPPGFLAGRTKGCSLPNSTSAGAL